MTHVCLPTGAPVDPVSAEAYSHCTAVDVVRSDTTAVLALLMQILQA